MDYAVAILIQTGYLLALLKSRIGRRSCAAAAFLFYACLVLFESMALNVEISGLWFFTGTWTITLFWFITLVRIGAMPCVIAAGAMLLLDIMMIFDAVLYPRMETALYLNYEYIAISLHMFMLFGVWSISRGIFDDSRRRHGNRHGNHNNLPGV